MLASSFIAIRKFKSPIRVLAAILYRSRKHKARQLQQARKKIDQLQRELQKTQNQLQKTQDQLQTTQDQLQATQEQLQNQTPAWPHDPPVGTHGYGPILIALAVNLAQKTGIRTAVTAMKIFFHHLQIKQKVPDHTAVRSWMQRLGLAALQAPLEQADDWIWMVDHSAQTGPEKVLVVSAVRAAQLPEPGTPLRHQDMRTIHLQTGQRWNGEDMGQVYAGLVEKFGLPRCILSDEASELQQPARNLSFQGRQPVVLMDFKHRAANIFKRLIGNTERFGEWLSLMGKTRSRVRQTELAHLKPPTPKPKARFMNMQPTLQWGRRMLWLLEHPEAECRKHLPAELLEEKLGWIRLFRQELEDWGRCQQLISLSVRFISEQGLYRGCYRTLHLWLREWISDSALVRQLAGELLCFVKQSEELLEAGERLSLSTEILESQFALYKQLEGQHSKGGFTSLLATFAGLGRTWTPEKVKEAFARVKVKDVKTWVQANLGKTMVTRHREVCQEHTAATSATKTKVTT